MKLEFVRQELVNFKAFTGRHEIVWDSPGLNFYRGENDLDKDLIANGAGKSTLFDAWCWCLYGRTPRGLRNPQITPWREGADEPTSVLNWIKLDGATRSVRRTVQPNRLTLDGEDINQDKLDQLLGLNFELATNTILLAQNRPLFFDRTPEQKMELFAQTLNLERWDRRAELATLRWNANEGEIDKLVRDRELACTELDTIAGELKQAQAEADKWGTQATKSKRDIEARIRDLQQSLARKQELLDAADLAEDGAATELKALLREAEKLKDDSRATALEVHKAEQDVATAQSAVKRLRQELTELQRAKTCPTCGQSVRPANLKKHKQEIERQIAEYAIMVERGIPVKLAAAVKSRAQQLQRTTQHIESFTRKRDDAEANVKLHQPEVSKIKIEIEHLREDLKALSGTNVNPFFDQIRRLRLRATSIGDELVAIEKDLKQEQQRFEQHKIWARGFKEIKLQLIEDVLHELEIVTNAKLTEFGLAGWNVHYDIEKELKSGDIKRVFNVEISSPESDGFVKWENWSGGEGERLKLIGALSLSDVLLAKAGIEVNLEILDEPAKYWSAPSVQDLTAFLAERARLTGRSIHLVEHQAAESAHFVRTLTVVKDAKGAYIAED